jgi:anti-sigma B factor antagonist
VDFSACITLQADHAHLTVAGELDALTALKVRWRLADALEHGCARFTVDVAGLTFIDAAGLGVFVHLHNSVGQLGGTLTFIDSSAAFRRACRLAGLTEAFGLSAPSTPVVSVPA